MQAGWLGRADVIPLAEVAAEAGQELQGGGVLDSFGHDTQAERVTEFDGRADEVQGAVAVVAGKRGGENPVQLEFPDRQVAEVPQ